MIFLKPKEPEGFNENWFSGNPNIVYDFLSILDKNEQDNLENKNK